MLIKSIKIVNFLSIGEIELTFDKSGLLLIEGWNHDTDSANGAGKSAVLSAIAWVLFGKLPRDITSSAIVRSGEKTCIVSCSLDVDDVPYSVVRTRSPNSISVSRDDSEYESVDQEQLDKILGISYERFLQVTYFAQGLGQRFLDLSDTEKKQLFLDLSQSVDYTSAKQKIDLQLKQLITNKLTLESEISQDSARVGELNSFLSSFSDSIDLHAMQAELASINQKLLSLSSFSVPDLSAHKELRGKLRKKLSQIQEAKGELRGLHSQLRIAKKPITKLSPLSCPHCKGNVLIDDGEILACDASAMDESHRKALIRQEAVIAEITANIDQLDKTVSKEARVVEAIELCETEMSNLTHDYDKNQEQILHYSRRKDSVVNALEQAEANEKRRKSTLDRINSLSAHLSVLQNDLQQLINKIKILESASLVLSPTGVQAYVLDSIIDQFNEYVRETLGMSWPSLSYELLSFKENKTGSVSAKFSDSVTLSGVPRSIGALSGGERRCLSIAIDVAISRVYELYSGSIVGPLIFDEPFDHMDASNRERAIDILQAFAQRVPVIVVDHMNESKGLFDHILTIQKRNGISSARIE